METEADKNTKKSSEKPNRTDEDKAVNEQISAIINEKLSESIRQIQDNPEKLTQKSFFKRVWQSTKTAIIRQLESISRGFYAAMIAIIVAVVTPLILNSSILDKISEMNKQIEGALPSEQEKEYQQRVMDFVSTVTETGIGLDGNLNLVGQSEVSQQIAAKSSALTTEFNNKLLESNASIKSLQEELESIKQHNQAITQRLSELNSSGFNTSKFLQRLKQLKNTGTKIQGQLGKENFNQSQLNRWLKTVYYLVASIPLSKQSHNESGSLLQQNMRLVVDAKDDFNKSSSQIAETMIILDSIELLAVSGLFSSNVIASN